MQSDNRKSEIFKTQLRIAVIAVVMVIITSLFSSFYALYTVRQVPPLFYMILCVSCLFASLLAFNYLIAQLRKMKQLQAQSALLNQQTLYDAYVIEKRESRAAISQLLYDMDDILTAPNIAHIRQHYDAVIEGSRYLTSENIVSLARVPSLPLRGLLTHQAQLAQAAKLPLYLYCTDLRGWTTLKDMDMCAILGVLVDNAREAAQCAAAPFVCIEIQEAEHALEIIIRNTFADLPSIAALREKNGSAKGHDHGQGLASVWRILEVHQQAQLKFMLHGQYLISHLLLPMRRR